MKTIKILVALFILHFNFQQASSQPVTPTTWSSRGVGGGGSVHDVAINPNDSNDMFMVCDMSDLFRTKDFGKHWTTQPFQNITVTNNSSVHFTNSPAMVYALRSNKNTFLFPVLSKDSGNTWNVLPLNPCTSGAFRMSVNPDSAGMFVIADKNKLFFSRDTGATYKGGISVNQPFYSVAANTKGLMLAGVFWDYPKIYVCTNKGLLISTNGGSNFNLLSDTAGINFATEEIINFSGAKRGNTTRFFCVTLSPNTVKPGSRGPDQGQFKNLYRKNVGDISWTNIKGNLSNPSANKIYFLATVRNNIDTLYLAGCDTMYYNGTHAVHTVFKTTDGGNTWANVFLNNYTFNQNKNVYTGWHGGSNDPTFNHNWYGTAFCGGLAVDPNNINRLAVTNSYDIHVSTNGGKFWKQAYTDETYQHDTAVFVNATSTCKTTGFEPTVAYWLTWADSLNLIAGLADLIAARSADGGNIWNMNRNNLIEPKINDISIMIKHPNGKIYAACGDIPGSNGDFTDTRLALLKGKIAFTADNGLNWDTIGKFKQTVTGIAIDPNHPDTMYAAIQDTARGAGGIYVCYHINSPSPHTWVKLNSPARTQGRASTIKVLKDGTLLCTYAARDTGRITQSYYYPDSSGVFYSDNAGTTWKENNPVGLKYNVTDVVIDPNDPSDSTWFAASAAGGTTQFGLFRTTNRGGSWTKVFGTGVISCTFHPDTVNHKHEMYLCTEFDGLYYVSNTHSSFDTVALSAYPFRRPQRVFFNPYNVNEVWVAGFGNGYRVGNVPVAIDTTITSIENALPVELISFDVYAVENSALLQWETAIEINNEKFEVERSADAISFQKIGEVQGNGNSTSLQQYSFTDEDAHNFASQKNQTVVYYRLKQIDYDGAFEYTEIHAANFSASNFMASLLFPNPAQSNTRIEYELSDASDVEISIYDLNGRKIISLSDEHQTAGKHSLDFNTDMLAAGIYFVRMNAGGIICKKLVKQ